MIDLTYLLVPLLHSKVDLTYLGQQPDAVIQARSQLPVEEDPSRS